MAKKSTINIFSTDDVKIENNKLNGSTLGEFVAIPKSTSQNSHVSKQLTLNDLYEESWKCRNFEIKNLWQRSVFLAVFMIAVATGYGTFVLKMIFTDNPNINMEIRNNSTIEMNVEIDRNVITSVPVDPTYLHDIEFISEQKSNTHIQHIVAASLCYLGLAFSMLWTMMAKGSKLWYERYEANISWFLKGEHRLVENLESSKLDPPWHGNFCEAKWQNDSLFSTSAGNYSVSRINSAIGILGMGAWSLLAMFHAGNAFQSFFRCKFGLLAAVFAIIQFLIVKLILYLFLYSLCYTKPENKKIQTSENYRISIFLYLAEGFFILFYFTAQEFTQKFPTAGLCTKLLICLLALIVVISPLLSAYIAAKCD